MTREDAVGSIFLSIVLQFLSHTHTQSGNASGCLKLWFKNKCRWHRAMNLNYRVASSAALGTNFTFLAILLGEAPIIATFGKNSRRGQLSMHALSQRDADIHTVLLGAAQKARSAHAGHCTGARQQLVPCLGCLSLEKKNKTNMHFFLHNQAWACAHSSTVDYHSSTWLFSPSILYGSYTKTSGQFCSLWFLSSSLLP